MPSCAIYGCPNYSRKSKGTGIRYYSFPKDKHLAQQWITICRRLDPINIYNGRICSKHFHPSAFAKSLKHQLLKYQPKSTRDLKPDALPTEFLPNKKQSLTTKSKRKQTRPKPQKEVFENDTEVNEFMQDPLSETSSDAMSTEFLPHEKQSWSSNSNTNERLPKRLEIENIKQEVFENDIELNEFKVETQSDPLSETSPEPSTSELYKLIEQLKTDNLNLKNQNEILQHNLASMSNELESMKAMLKKKNTGNVFILRPM